MACRKKADRLLGIIRSKAELAPSLPGRDGFVLVEYHGNQEHGAFPTSLLTGARYTYGTGRRRLYVDARDSGRVLNWSENGTFVFERVEGTDA